MPTTIITIKFCVALLTFGETICDKLDLSHPAPLEIVRHYDELTNLRFNLINVGKYYMWTTSYVQDGTDI